MMLNLVKKNRRGLYVEDEDCPLSSKFKHDLKAIHSTAPFASKIQVPWLLVHGTTDDVVLIDDSREAYSLANEPKQLIEIEGGKPCIFRSGIGSHDSDSH